MKKLLTILFLLISINVIAPLAPWGPEPPPGPPCWPPPCIPVDGGILTFTFFTMLFGVKKIKDNF
tara:strand:- start:20880 stop:21074 length:195 start_codon:yes stop_codon:yes gene_type:complete